MVKKLEGILESRTKLEHALRAKVGQLVAEKNALVGKAGEDENTIKTFHGNNNHLREQSVGLRNEIDYYRVELLTAHTLLGRTIHQHAEVRANLNLGSGFPTNNQRNPWKKKQELKKMANQDAGSGVTNKVQ